MTKKFILLGLFATAAWGDTTATVTVTAAPAAVAFSYQIGAPKLPGAQVVSLRASSGTSTYTAVIAPVGGKPVLWLTVTPDTGKMPGSLSFQVNPTSLAVASYPATVNVTVTGVKDPVVIPVTLNVTAAPAILTLGSSTLTFTGPPTPVAQVVPLTSTGSTISFTANSGSTWLSVTPTAGVLRPGAQISLKIAIDLTGLTPQTAAYSGKITVTPSATATSAAKPQTITVSLTVGSSTPTITSVWPINLPMNEGAQTITIRGTNFYKATTASIVGMSTPLVTTFKDDSTLLFAVVPAAQLTAPAKLKIGVTNPTPGGPSLTTKDIDVGAGPVIAFVGNVASYDAKSISPGEIVTIFGSNLGPSTPASMTITGGNVDKTLGNVSVLVDKLQAPMLYVSENQVTIQVPYDVKTGTNKEFILTNATVPSAIFPITISAVAPGVFTADGSGVGLAAALNTSATTLLASVNTASNPALAGDSVTIYLTGEGDYNPALAKRTGLIVTSPPTPAQITPQPTVTIGGVAAKVTYAGPSVGSILGLLQIDMVVPAGVTAGKTVPLIVTFGASPGTAAPEVSLSIH